MASVCDLRIPLWPTQYVHRLRQTAHKSIAKEPISSYLHE